MNTQIESSSQHFQALQLSTRFLVGSSIFVTAVAVLLTAMVIEQVVPTFLVASAQIFAALSAFLAGNTFSLSDARTRAGLKARAAGLSPMQLIASLPPLRVVRYRFRMARLGFSLATLMVLLSFFTVRFELTSIKPLAGVALLGLVVSVVTFLCGMWTRPIDNKEAQGGQN